MAKRARSPERAAQVLDRAARMRSFAPGLMDRRLFDAQMRTPGRSKSPIGDLNHLGSEQLRYQGVQSVPLKAVRSEQPTVSVSAVKKKLTAPAPSSPKRMPLVLHHQGTYHVMDGNHRVTAARALRSGAIQARVVELNAAAFGAPSATPKALPAVRPAASSIPKAAGRLGLAVGVAAAAYGLYKAMSKQGGQPQGQPAAPAPSPQRTSDARSSYQTVDGRAVEGTKAQIEAWRRRRSVA